MSDWSPDRPWRFALIGTLFVALLAGLLAIWAKGRFEWGPAEIPKAQGEAIDKSFASSSGGLRYRSSVVAAVIREPENTWSNLAFVFAGLVVAAHDRRIFGRLFGTALVALGIASGLYHASLLSALRTFDVGMMGWAVFSLGCLGWFAVGRTWAATSIVALESSSAQLTVGLAGAVLAVATAIFRNTVKIAGVKAFDSTYVTVTGIGVVLLFLAGGMVVAAQKLPAGRIPTNRILGLFLVVGAAIIFQLGDHPGKWLFQPESLIQAHAAWHILMALAALQCHDLFALIEGRVPLFLP